MKKVINKSIIFTILTVLILYSFSEVIFTIYKYNYEKDYIKELNDQVQNNAQLIQESVIKKVYTVDTLKVMLKLTEFDLDRFYDWAPIIYETVQGIASIQLAPDGVVQHIYPLEGNEEAIGHDLLADKSRDDGARKAIESGELIFIGPVTLIQNGKQAVISRRPIFIKENNKKEFWGFTTVIINLDDLPIKNILSNEKYSFRILGYDPDNQVKPIIYESDNLDFWDAEYPIYVPGAIWTLQMSAKNSNSLLYMHILIHGITILIGCFYIFQHYKMIRQASQINILNKRLKILTYKDELTGLYNRRGIYKKLNEAISSADSINISIMDLDNFKYINDTFGHGTGDRALEHVSHLISKVLYGNVAVGRLGGDEFLCIFTDIDIEESKKMLTRLKDEFKSSPIEYKGNSISISISIGTVEYKQEESVEELLIRGDKAMYEEKRKKWNSTH